MNTARVKTHARVMTHVEGGWPKEIDYSEAQDTLKYRKRLEKDLSDLFLCQIVPFLFVAPARWAPNHL